jgi:hypothetical protein
VVLRGPCVLLGRHDHRSGARGEAGIAITTFGLRLAEGVGDEALLHRLLGDAHALPDVGPAGTRSPGLIDEVTDEVIGHLVQLCCGLDGGRQVLERSPGRVLLDHGGDQVVQANR